MKEPHYLGFDDLGSPPDIDYGGFHDDEFRISDYGPPPTEARELNFTNAYSMDGYLAARSHPKIIALLAMNHTWMKEEDEMPNLATLRQDAERLAKRIAILEEEERKKTRPKEPQHQALTSGQHPTVVYFRKRFQGNQTYDYCAVRPWNRTEWSVTGRGELTSVSWDAILDEVERDERDKGRALGSIRVATAWMPLA